MSKVWAENQCHHHSTTRRNLLAGAAATLFVPSAAACDFLSTDADQGSQSSQNGGESNPKESPQLTELVNNGKLPPLEDRLPKNPLVLEPVDRIGQYGGEWSYAMDPGCPGCYVEYTVGFESLVVWSPDRIAFTVDEIVPNVAESFDINAETTEYTLGLREGMKWSDGEPYTADDIMFWYEDVFTNPDLTPAFSDWMLADGEPFVVEKIDDYTVVFRFSAPNGLFLQNLAYFGKGVGHVPAHYMKQFHAKHNENIDQEVESANHDDWLTLFHAKVNWQENPERPVLNAWLLTKEVGASQNFTAERNPYCFKVDPAGSQLPYLDRVRFSVVEQDVLVLKIANGEVDVKEEISDLPNKPIYAKSRESGNYRFIDVQPVYMNTHPIALNLTHKDEARRQIFQNKDFRIGLSYAINRQEVIDTTLQRQGEPFQCAPRPESPFYNEQLAKQYTEFDVEKANEHLDKVLPDRDSNDMRLQPDGQPFKLVVDLNSEEAPDALELIEQYWKDVGVNTVLSPLTRDLFFARTETNEQDAMTVWGDGGLEVILDPRSYLPWNFYSFFALPWANWYAQGGLEGNLDLDSTAAVTQEPPEEAKEQMRLYDEIKKTADPEEQSELMGRILDIAVEQFWMIGVSLPVGSYGIVKNDFHNVPEMIVASAGKSGLPYPQQFFVERP